MPESAFIGAFEHNPLPFIAAALCALMALLMAVVALVLALGKRGAVARVVSLVALGASLFTLLPGVVGWQVGRSSTDLALEAPGLTPVDRERMRRFGYSEALYPLYFALGAFALPLLLGGAGVVLSLERKPDD